MQELIELKKTLYVLVLFHFTLASSVTVVKKMSDIVTGNSMTARQAHICKMKLSASIIPSDDSGCSSRCPNCAVVVFNEETRECSLCQLSDCCEKPVNSSAECIQGLLTGNLTVNMTFQNLDKGPHGKIQTMSVIKTGCYNVTAKGAKGGRHVSMGISGCLGAVKGGSFMFNSGDELRVVVGQEGGATRAGYEADCAGAGGASFIFTTSGDLLLAAGGAGGVEYWKDSNCSGQAGLKAGHSWDGNYGQQYTGYRGENGTTGSIGPDETTGNDGGVGASWFSSGPAVRAGETWGGRPGHNLSGNFSGGLAPAHNHSTFGLFEAHGGFGGGGSGSPGSAGSVLGSGGSGGGYSSGGAGSRSQTGGGGSSFASPMATNVWGITGGNTEAHGSVTFLYTGPTCG